MAPAARYAAAIDTLDRIRSGEVVECAKRDGTNSEEANRLHLHSLVYRSRAKRIAEAIGKPRMRNPITED